MSSKYVVDRGVLGKLQRTATGGYRIPATLARVGVMDYIEDGKVVRHYNPPEVLQAALDSVVDVPVTNRHPKKMVDAASYRDVARGHVLGSPEFRDGHIHATLAIQDAQLLADIEAGVCREVSMGYSVEFDNVPGETPDGEKYDVLRTKIDWNHIAVVPQGRAGKSVRCLLDSDQIPEEEVIVFKIDGADVAQDQAQAAIDRLQGKADALQAQVADLQTKLDAALSEEAIDAAVQKRVDAAEAAKAEAKRVADAAERKAKVLAARPELKLDDKSQDYIDGLFDALPSDPDGLNQLRGKGPKKPVIDAAPRLSAREKMLARLREESK